MIDLVSTCTELKNGREDVTCISAVARITPDPKYLATKKIRSGTFTSFALRLLAAYTGTMAPSAESTSMTKMELMRRLICPSKLLPSEQDGIFSNFW